MVPPGDEAQVEVLQDRCTVCIEHTIGLKITLDAPDGTLRRCWSCGISFLSLWRQCNYRCKILVKDRSTVCAKCPIGSEIDLDTPNGPPRWRGSSERSIHLETLLILKQDRCTVSVECTIGSEIVLDALNGTPSWRGSCWISLLSVWR
jgi:hypothetical protein